MENRIERLCGDKGLRMTSQRRVIARVLSDAEDHPSVPDVHRRAAKLRSQHLNCNSLPNGSTIRGNWYLGPS